LSLPALRRTVQEIIDTITERVNAILDINFVDEFNNLLNTFLTTVPTLVRDAAELLTERLPAMIQEAFQKFLAAGETQAMELLDTVRDLLDAIIGTRYRAVVDFFDRVKFIVTEYIPELARTTWNAVSTIAEALTHITRCPTTVIEALNWAVRLLIKNVYAFLSLKDEVVEAFGVITGGLPDWVLPTEEYDDARVYC
jgi:phage-related protein